MERLRELAYRDLDAALLLIWLTCAIFRIGVLCTAIRMLGQEYAIQKRKEVRQ